MIDKCVSSDELKREAQMLIRDAYLADTGSKQLAMKAAKILSRAHHSTPKTLLVCEEYRTWLGFRRCTHRVLQGWRMPQLIETSYKGVYMWLAQNGELCLTKQRSICGETGVTFVESMPEREYLANDKLRYVYLGRITLCLQQNI